jgi:hypothetical protein
MNAVLPEIWIEQIERLALGLEPLDGGHCLRIAQPIRVVFDEEARGLARPRVERHPSCLHVLLYARGVEGRVRLRFFEVDPVNAADQEPRSTAICPSVGGFTLTPRHFVPRLISFPILPLAQAEKCGYRHRVRRPVLFPGAAYDVAAGMPGLRGRVECAGKQVRWARVTARLPGNGVVVGRAHGDDRGEFLLLVSAAASPVGDIVDPLKIALEISRPKNPPPPPRAGAETDPLWDLPEELAPVYPSNDPFTDPVSAGESLPPNYTNPFTYNIDLTFGTIRSQTTAFDTK